MTDKERDCWLGFSAFPGIGPLRFKLLITYFGSAQKAWNAPHKKLAETGLGDKIAQHFDVFRETFRPGEYRKKMEDKNIWFITLNEPGYPLPLKEIGTSPFLLYIRGRKDIKWDWDRMVGVVGTRNITTYGAQVTEKITEELIASGITIVSGMAIGVDGVAHATALAHGGKTIAVLGCGVDVVHPVRNSTIYWKIVREGGWVVSEFPMGQFATKGLFPARNRIISGLSRGVVVTEGASDSGALITARYALEQGRDVFAVPGPITSSMSAAPTALLKQGAKLVTEAKDILEELNLNIKYQISNIKNKMQNSKIGNINLAQEEIIIIELLQREALHFDDLVRKSKIDSAKLAGLLTAMELRGLIQQKGGLYLITLH